MRCSTASAKAGLSPATASPCEDCGCVGLVLASTAFGLFCPPALVGEPVVRSAQLVGDVGVAGSGQVHQRLSLRHVGRVGLGE